MNIANFKRQASYLNMNRRNIHSYINFVPFPLHSRTFHSISFHFIPFHSISLRLLPIDSTSFHFIAFHHVSLHYVSCHFIAISKHYVDRKDLGPGVETDFKP